MFKEKLVQMLKSKFGKNLKDTCLEIPPSPDLGDYAFACFPFAKKLRKNPKDIALEAATVLHIEKPNFIEKIIPSAGYINFFLKTNVVAKKVLEKINKDKTKYGKTNLGKKKEVMIEFSQPNTNKPMHLGHLRTTLLGDCLCNIFEFENYKVIRTNLVNDRGIHICKSMLAYKRWGKNSTPESKGMNGDHFVGYFYVLFQKKLKEHPKLEESAQRMLKKWEKGDKEILKLWKQMNKWCLQGFEETYKELEVKFDKVYFESKYWKKGKKTVLDYCKKGKFVKGDDGEIIAPLEKFNLPDKVVLRTDGTALYVTQDIYLAMQKFSDFKINKSIYVVAREQDLHFKQLFAILRLMGFKWWDKNLHYSYGMVNLPEGKMKSREGTVVDADDLIFEMETLAKEELKERYSNLSNVEIKKRSNVIGLAALRFFLLKVDAIKDMIFNPKEAIPFEGDTGPYVQYTYARASSILRKAGRKKLDPDYSLFEKDSEIKLIKKLLEFPEVVENACNNLRPHLIAQFLIDLCQAFNDFYQTCKCLSAEDELRDTRLILVKCVRITLKNGLSLLGINSLEEM